jgi:hypothetical protein
MSRAAAAASLAPFFVRGIPLALVRGGTHLTMAWWDAAADVLHVGAPPPETQWYRSVFGATPVAHVHVAGRQMSHGQCTPPAETSR